MRCFIFAAGTFYGLREEPREGDLIIAADAGYRVCREAGILPDVLLGDFDSMDVPEDAAARVLRAPVEKDDTDTMLAVRYGLGQGCREFFLYGGTGGKRLDHTVANLQTLLFLERNGARGWLYDLDFVFTAVRDGTVKIRREVEWGLVSLFCMGEDARGVTLTGLQYPLSNAVITPDFPLAVSNHIVAPEASVTVEHGALIVGWELPESAGPV